VIRYIADKAGTVYAVAFDSDGVVDTIKVSGKAISADKPKAQTILNNAAPIHCGVLPDRMAKAGWTWPKRT